MYLFLLLQGKKDCHLSLVESSYFDVQPLKYHEMPKNAEKCWKGMFGWEINFCGKGIPSRAGRGTRNFQLKRHLTLKAEKPMRRLVEILGSPTHSLLLLPLWSFFLSPKARELTEKSPLFVSELQIERYLNSQVLLSLSGLHPSGRPFITERIWARMKRWRWPARLLHERPRRFW